MQKYNRISADCHLDMPWMPPDLFTSMAPGDMKDRMPFVVETDEAEMDRQQRRVVRLKNGVGPSGSSTAGQATPGRRDGRDRPLRGRRQGHPPRLRPAPAHQGSTATASTPR